eukprot:3330105-Pleurochrysis_carterae.AAC.1
MLIGETRAEKESVRARTNTHTHRRRCRRRGVHVPSERERARTGFKQSQERQLPFCCCMLGIARLNAWPDGCGARTMRVDSVSCLDWLRHLAYR